MIPLTMNETQNFHLNGMKFSFFQKGRWESWPLWVVRCPPSSFLSRPLWQPFSFLFKFSSLTTAVSVTSQVYWEKEPICSSCLSPSGYHSAAMGRCWPEAIICPTETGMRAGRTCVLRISQAFSKSTAEFSCAYEENMSSRWIPFLQSQTVTGSQ